MVVCKVMVLPTATSQSYLCRGVKDGSSPLHIAAIKGSQRAAAAMLGEFICLQHEYVRKHWSCLGDGATPGSGIWVHKGPK